MNIEYDPLRGQPSDSVELEGFLYQAEEYRSTDLPESTDQDLKNKVYLIQGNSSIRILHVLSKFYPKELLATEIAEIIDTHRSTVSIHCRELADLGIINLNHLPGTENKVNPTYLFSLAPEFQDEIQKFLELKLASSPKLAEINENAECLQNQDFHQLVDPTSQSVDETDEATEMGETEEFEEDQPSLSFEEQVEHGFKVLTRQLLEMQEEINELKRRLNEKPKPKKDLTELFSVFDSNNYKKGGKK